MPDSDWTEAAQPAGLGVDHVVRCVVRIQGRKPRLLEGVNAVVSSAGADLAVTEAPRRSRGRSPE